MISWWREPSGRSQLSGRASGRRWFEQSAIGSVYRPWGNPGHNRFTGRQHLRLITRREIVVSLPCLKTFERCTCTSNATDMCCMQVKYRYLALR